MSRLGIFLEELPFKLTLEYAKAAEKKGFESIWVPEITTRDSFTPCSAIATSTSEIKISSGVVGIYSRSPVVTALTMSGLSEISDGRAVLGLGTQAPPYVELWHGLSFSDPVQRMKEYVKVVKEILSGKNVNFWGKIFKVHNFKMTAQPAQVPVYSAGLNPRMVQAGGESADGVLGYAYPVNYVPVAKKNIEIGAKRAARDPSDIDLAVGLPTMISNDSKYAYEQIKPQIVMWANHPHYTRFFKMNDMSKEMVGMRTAIANGNVPEALEMVSDKMIETFTITGTPNEAKARIKEYENAGVNLIVLNPVPPGTIFPMYAGHLAGIGPSKFHYDLLLKNHIDAIENLT